MLPLDTLCKSVIEISTTIGDWILNEQKNFNSNSIELKTFNNLVSYVDKESEQQFITELSKIFPNCGFIGEEGVAKSTQKEYTWIIDPLDGTTNFAHSVPIFCTSVALFFENRIILGVVYDPSRKEVFYATENGGAYLNGSRIFVSAAESLQTSLVSTGFPYDDFTRMGSYMNIFQELAKNTRGIRRCGSAAIDLCYVACGRFDAFFEYALSSWDVAAGSLIVKEANGQVSDFNNGKNYIFGEEIIASNSKIHDTIQHLISKEFTI